MRLELGLNLRLSQQLRLAPQIIQSIEILQLQAMDLKELIENELQENEALEIVEPSRDDLDDVAANGREEDGSFEDDAERVLDRLDALADAERGPGGYASRAAGQEASDRKLEAMQNTPAGETGLAEHLVHQLEEMELTPDVRRAAEAIVYNLDDGGLPPLPHPGGPRRDGRARRPRHRRARAEDRPVAGSGRAWGRATCPSACSCRSATTTRTRS